MKSPRGPIDHLWDSREEEEGFSALVERAFNFPACINRHDIQHIGLLKGSALPGDEITPPSRAVIDRFARMQSLSSESDGVRAFTGILLEAVAGKPKIALIDEPETFLNPRHAKLIGRYLVEETSQDSQVFIATHSSEVLQGVLDANRNRGVKIIRLTREDDGTRSSRVLASDRVEKLWSDPLLRYARFLDGLFHQGVIICEADNDCRFYEAVLDACIGKGVEHDLLFTHVGGKGRFPLALADMNFLGVRTAIVGDIDVLNDTSALEKIVKAAGGEYARIASNVKVVQEQVRGMGGGATVLQVKNRVKDLFLQHPDKSSISSAERKSIVDVLGGQSGWDRVKTGGVRSLKGAAPSAALSVLEYLRSIGIFLVPVGELEGWYFQLDVRKGAPYVIEVLEHSLHREPPPELEKFIRELAQYFGITL